ncbi:hypothetical protein EVAR_46407_1 [Eumeta japonica]|uniref:Uncharacterized protein n=1 Tax=Eumeta variegata TaxID=151549 RepID=A0A4C1WW43_EUMVA|nr:hypothetical protein EVAR_46407_1 [Eumeta japonica]
MIKGHDKWNKKVTRWYPREGKRKRGRPQRGWDDDIREVAGALCYRVAQDRSEWKRHKKPTSFHLQRAIDQLGRWLRNLEDRGCIQTVFAESHPNALLRSAVSYKPPHPRHFIRRPRNVLTDPLDALAAAVESLMEVNDTHD